jgi:hypothetical protein
MNVSSLEERIGGTSAGDEHFFTLGAIGGTSAGDKYFLLSREGMGI